VGGEQDSEFDFYFKPRISKNKVGTKKKNDVMKDKQRQLLSQTFPSHWSSLPR